MSTAKTRNVRRGAATGAFECGEKAAAAAGPARRRRSGIAQASAASSRGRDAHRRGVRAQSGRRREPGRERAGASAPAGTLMTALGRCSRARRGWRAEQRFAAEAREGLRRTHPPALAARQHDGARAAVRAVA